MLAHVAQPYPNFDVDSIWDTLQNLLIVKQRKLPAFMVDGNDPDATLLFLHDEMYYWFDQHGRAQSEVDVTEAIIVWYEQQINALEQERGKQTLALLEHEPTPDTSTNALPEPSNEYRKIRERLATITRRQEQYRLDLLHYRYQTNAGSKQDVAPSDLVSATHTYNLLAYEAILGRELGTGTTLRQETLQNSYRLLRTDTLPPFIQAECAARWLLRIAYNDVQATANPEETITKASAFTEQLGDAPEDQLARALMDVAEANFRIEKVGVAGKDERKAIEDLLISAEELLQTFVSMDEQTQLWTTFLRAEIYELRGYAARRQYNLSEAIRNYREAYTIAREQERLKKLQAQILNNLAFALSEQGLVDESRELAQTALRIRLQSASDYDIALSRNTLARIEIRAGQPALAYQFAVLADEAMHKIGSVRGRLLSLPVRAESLRKLAEQLAHAPAQQNKLFDEAIKWLDEADTLLQQQTKPSVERQREVYQNLGCAYRSKALARQNRLQAYNPDSNLDEQVLKDYEKAREWLEKALNVSRDGQQPDLFVIDILEDLAVTYINEDLYDQRYEDYLKQGIAIIDARYRDYVITPGRGFKPLTAAIRGYWRELGQIHLQWMLGNFGKYEYGYYSYDKNTDSRTEKIKPGNEQFIDGSDDDALTHLVLTFGYLRHYDSEGAMLKRARYLALRELTRNFKASKLAQMSQRAVYLADRVYRLSPGTRDAIQRVFKQAINNINSSSLTEKDENHADPI
ncbi:tetratricopeptide repeat protein [bacterium]|nr:tetratricopeptide repeat protein [bacterium]